MRRPQAFRYLSNEDESDALQMVDIQVRSHAYDGSPAGIMRGRCPHTPGLGSKMPQRRDGWGEWASPRVVTPGRSTEPPGLQPPPRNHADLIKVRATTAKPDSGRGL